MNTQDREKYQKFLFDNLKAYREYKGIMERVEGGNYNELLLSMPISYIEKCKKLVELYEEMQSSMKLYDTFKTLEKVMEEKL